jgi:alkyl hydroperoxide reductase subunit AhpF
MSSAAIPGTSASRGPGISRRPSRRSGCLPPVAAQPERPKTGTHQYRFRCTPVRPLKRTQSEVNRTREASTHLAVLIIGGGPAGLAAAIYLARYRRRLLLIDSQRSRAEWIPRSHNLAGLSDGLSGTELLGRMTRQAKTYRAPMLQACVNSISREQDGSFTAVWDSNCTTSRTVLLATGGYRRGAVDSGRAICRRTGSAPVLPDLRCYEVIDRKLAIVGHGSNAVGEALFMTSYSRELTLLTLGQRLPDDERRRLDAADIGVEQRQVFSTIYDGAFTSSAEADAQCGLGQR